MEQPHLELDTTSSSSQKDHLWESLTVCSLLFSWQDGSSWSMKDVIICWMLNACWYPSSLKAHKLLLHLWGKRSCCHSVTEMDRCPEMAVSPQNCKDSVTMYELAMALHTMLKQIWLICFWDWLSCPSPLSSFHFSEVPKVVSVVFFFLATQMKISMLERGQSFACCSELCQLV